MKRYIYIQRAGHHQPDWETNEGTRVKIGVKGDEHVLQDWGTHWISSGELGTTSQTGRPWGPTGIKII